VTSIELIQVYVKFLCCIEVTDAVTPVGWLVGWLEFNVPFQHKHGYSRDERSGVETYPYPVKKG